MKSLFFVSVAVGILSGTSISAKAQTSVNLMRLSETSSPKKPAQFIEGIEIKRDVKVAEEDIWEVPVKKVSKSESSKTSAKLISTEMGAAIENCTSLQFKYAQMMDIEVESITNVNLYEAIEKWWATRYRYGGTTKKGIDCSALTGTLINEGFGIVLPRTARAQYAECNKLSRENLAEGDLVFFNTTGGVSHVGVYLGNSYFIHASVHSGVTINSLNENYYSKKYIGGGRIIK